MNAEVSDARALWTAKGHGPGRAVGLRRQRLFLVGARFERSWLEQSAIETSEIYFEGELAQAIADLLAAARDSSSTPGMALPITRLRASLLAHVPSVIGLDRDLGTVRNGQPRRAAIIVNRWATTAEVSIPDTMAKCLRRWYHDALSGWAERRANAAIAERVFNASTAANIGIVSAERRLLVNAHGKTRPDYALIARQLADSLIGEELFEGLGPCELVTDALYRDPARGNSVELMTAPTPLARQEAFFSMVARFAVVTVPYSRDVFLRVSAMKRAWAAKEPGPKRNAPFAVRGYVIGPERPYYTVSLTRTQENGWQFGDDYSEWQQVSDDVLPPNLAEAVSRQAPDKSGWWAGLPLLTTLFDTVPQRTVFEGDELDLRDEVLKRVPEILDAEIPFRTLQLPRRRSTSEVAMLKLSDLGLSNLGLAGQVLEESEPESSEASEDDDAAEELGGDQKRRASLDRHREQNILAIKRIHAEQQPVLWSFCSSEQERIVIARTVDQLFGDAVQLHAELLPQNTHGLRERLPGSKSAQRDRFDLRVQAWKTAAEAVRKSPGPRHVLICASDRDQGRAEDPVNYYAGLHAMCHLADANVHHVLPIAGGEQTKATQHFVHRLQSALLDVFFAHSGVIFGTREFLTSLFADRIPTYIYGIQAARSQARAFSGEKGVSFLLFTRLHVQKGTTEVRFVYRAKRNTERTAWMALNEGLRWLGSQRLLESDEGWLRDVSATQVRDFLGDLRKNDPRALVLVDWSTMASLWKGLSDEDLTRDGIARIDGKDIAAACPQITLVRLRKGESTIALRARNTSMYQRTGQRQELANLDFTGEDYTETYATTTKAIVALEESSKVPTVRAPRHYIQSMGYRNTVQIVRGQSCFHPTQRMRRSKVSRHTFQLEVLEPGQQDAALPAPLEVTVMTCPSDVNPDHVAVAVLGLRLGYVHYNDWTALPAPLFFKRKVDDHIVRYRSPSAVAVAEEDAEEADLVVTALSGAAGIETEPTESAEASIDAAPVEDPPQSEYLRQAAQEVAPLASISEDQALVAESVADAKDAAHEAPVSAVSDEELQEISDKADAPDDQLIGIMQRLGRENFALCVDSSDLRRRQQYDRLMRGELRVQVPTPHFVTITGIFERAPADKEALRRFWRDQVGMGWVRHGESMPNLSKLSNWILKRLQTPQGGYSVFSSRLFPRRTLFLAIHEGWLRYVEERTSNAAPDDTEARALPNKGLRLDLLTEWAVAQSNDDLIAWLIVGCAHFPSEAVLTAVLPFVKSPLGSRTREALYYFVDCVRASRAVINGKTWLKNEPLIFPARMIWRTELPVAAPSLEVAAQSVPADAREPDLSLANADLRVGDAPSAQDGVGDDSAPAVRMSTIVAAVPQLIPGTPAFEIAVGVVRRELELLEGAHQEALRFQEEARIAAESAAVEERARVSQLEQWRELKAQASELIARIHAELPDMKSVRAVVVEEAPESLDEVRRTLQELRGRIASAKEAQLEYERVDARATPPANLTAREARNHRVQWQDAVRSAHEILEESLSALTVCVRESPVFEIVETREPVEPADLPALEVREREEIVEQPPGAVAIEEDPVPVTPTPSHHEPSAAVISDVPATQAEQVAEIGVSPELVTDEIEGVFSAREEQEDEVEAQLTLEPMAHRGRAKVVLDLAQRRAFAAAAIYVQAIQLDFGAGRIGDHVIVAAAAIESVRRLRSEGSSGEEVANAALRARIENVGEIQLSGCDPVAAGLGVMAAGICEMLFPSANAGARWTFINQLQHRFDEHPHLRAFIERIGELEGIFLAQEMLTEASIGARQAALNQVARMRERAKNWHIDEALYRNWQASDYRQLHESLFRNENFPIARCLGLIARGEDDKLTEAYRDARKRMSRPLNVIEDLGKRMGRRKGFDGVARGHISSNIERTQLFIDEYLEAVRRANGLQAPVGGNARGVLQALYETLTAATEAVQALAFTDSLDSMYREVAITALLELKRMFDCGEPSKALSEADQMLLLRLPLGRDGKPSLLSLLDAGGMPLPAVVDPLTAIEEIESFERRLSDSPEGFAEPEWVKKQLEDACDDHLANARLLAARLIDQRLGRTTARGGEQARAMGSLKASLHRERQRVTHAMALGALGQAEASKMLRLIEEMLGTTTFGDPVTAPSGTPDFPHALDALRRLVTQPLDAQLVKSKVAFLHELDEYLELHSSSPELPLDIDRIRALANESASSMRAARDMFSLLKEGALPKKIVAAGRTPADDYKEFIRDLRDSLRGNRPLIDSVIRKLGSAPEDGDPAWLAILDSQARVEAVSFLETWERTCAAKSAQSCEKSLGDFLRALRPLEPTLNMAPDAHNVHRSEFFLENSPLAGLDRATNGLFIPPALGSERQFIQGIVVRQTAPEAAVTQALDELGQAAPTLLLGRANWTMERRAALSRHHPVLLIDDYLVVYAALHPHQRLQKLLQIALLTFSGNPYDDYGKPVPPEMFFGRQPELRRLRQVKTAAVLYGGRRLGKSSLLDQLQRDAQGRTGEAVLLLTLDRADRGLSDDHVLLAWSAIYRRLLQTQVLEKPKNEPTTAVGIQRWIEDEILSGRCKARGIYLLIDEADEMMGGDLHRGGTFISGLLKLCESVREKCAMRFVVAGLHNLTRMANDENSPLGKFESIALKPFWSAEDIHRGIELIKTPLEALGFYFGKGREDMPLRIMAVCNFYPAFIQLYCKRLVEQLQVRRDKMEPPTYITEADLDKVELDREFLSDIRSKFRLNLDLDKRYAAIALVLADQYYSDGAHALTASEVRNLCDLIAGRHFETTGPGAYASLLEEMETLTILERVGPRYALRTPNVAMMLGDRDSIGQQLEALSAERPVQSRSRGEYRTVMTKPGSREQHTFPMPSAWVRHAVRGTAGDSHGSAEIDRQLLIFVGNDLSGLAQIAKLRDEWHLGDAAICQFGINLSPTAARSALLRSANLRGTRAAPTRRLQCIASGAWIPNDIPGYARLAATISAASAAVSAEQGTGSVTRLALIAHPARAYEVAKQLHSPVEKAANWRVVPVPLWTDDALYFRLERLEKPDIASSEDARKALLLASCGFGAEIERLCSGRLRLDDALRAPAMAEKNLAPDLQTFYGKIGMPPAVGKQELSNAEVLLRVLDGEARIPERTEAYRIESGVSPELFEFLQWMGLLQEAPGGTWQIPQLYRRLLA